MYNVVFNSQLIRDLGRLSEESRIVHELLLCQQRIVIWRDFNGRALHMRLITNGGKSEPSTEWKLKCCFQIMLYSVCVDPWTLWKFRGIQLKLKSGHVWNYSYEAYDFYPKGKLSLGMKDNIKHDLVEHFQYSMNPGQR